MQSASRQRRPVWRLSSIVGAVALTLALLPLAGGALAQVEDWAGQVDDLEAATNIDAAIAWSTYTFDAAEHAVIGRDDVFADNLASGMVQGAFAGPLLLTPTDGLDARTRGELERLGVTTVHILGGTQAISPSVQAELEQEGYTVVRRSGETRLETAIAVAEAYAADAQHVFLSRAFGDAEGDETQAWADALAGGAWAAESGSPILFTQQEQLSESTRAYIEESDIETVTILGGVQAVAPTVEAELLTMGVAVERVFGANRFATATAVAGERGYEDAGAVAEGDPVLLVEGQEGEAWASGFAAAAHAGMNDAPLVLSNIDTLPPETESWLEHDGSHAVTLVCGPFVHDEPCASATETLANQGGEEEPQEEEEQPEEEENGLPI